MSPKLTLSRLSEDITHVVFHTTPGLDTARRRIFRTTVSELVEDGLPELTDRQIAMLRDTLSDEIERLQHLSGRLGAVLGSRQDRPGRIARSA